MSLADVKERWMDGYPLASDEISLLFDRVEELEQSLDACAKQLAQEASDHGKTQQEVERLAADFKLLREGVKRMGIRNEDHLRLRQEVERLRGLAAEADAEISLALGRMDTNGDCPASRKWLGSARLKLRALKEQP